MPDERKTPSLAKAWPLSDLGSKADGTTYWESEYRCECGEQCIESSRHIVCHECEVCWRKE